MTAIDLRKAGHSYSYIAHQIKISKSTLAGWLANIPYTPNPETISRIGKARAASAAAQCKRKLESLKRARAEALEDIGTISTRDLFMLGLGLYIGEGMKSLSTTRFVNSNPTVLKFIVRWFIQALGLGRNNIGVRLHLYPDSNEEESINYWSSTLRIPRSQFSRSSIDRRQNKRAIKAGKLPHGTAHITIRSLGDQRFGVFLARKIAAWSDIALTSR